MILLGKKLTFALWPCNVSASIKYKEKTVSFKVQLSLKCDLSFKKKQNKLISFISVACLLIDRFSSFPSFVHLLTSFHLPVHLSSVFLWALLFLKSHMWIRIIALAHGIWILEAPIMLVVSATSLSYTLNIWAFNLYVAPMQISSPLISEIVSVHNIFIVLYILV